MREQRTRVIQIVTDGQLGGAQRSVQWVAGVANRREFDYFFIFLYSGGPCCDAIAAMGYPIEILHWSGGYTISGRLRLVRLLREIQPHLIHDHDATPCSRVWMRMALKCPIVSTQHGGFTSRSPLHYFFGWLDDRVTDLVFANSIFTAQKHSKLYHRPMAVIRTVYLGLDVERLSRASSARSAESRYPRDGNMRISFVGRVERSKGVLQLPLLAQALRKRGTCAFEILVAGDGSAKESLLRATNQLGMSQHIRYLGAQTDVMPLLQDSDIFIFPSLGDEAFGLAPLEALAAGVPVAAYDVGGVSESLQGAPGTRLVPPGDVEALADAIVTLTKSHGQRNDKGLEYVRRRFDVRRTACQVESLYAELLGLDGGNLNGPPRM